MKKVQGGNCLPLGRLLVLAALVSQAMPGLAAPKVKAAANAATAKLILASTEPTSPPAAGERMDAGRPVMDAVPPVPEKGFPSATPTSADDGIPLEQLVDVIKKALASNPEVGMAAANRRAATEEFAQAKAANLPTVDLRVAGGREQSENATTIAATGNDRSLTRREAGLTLRQNLFDGGYISHEVARQEKREEAAEARLRESREAIAFKVTDAYLEVQRNQQLMRLAEENLKTHLDIMAKSEERFKSGAGNKADYQLAEGRTALANATYVTRLGALQESRAKYIRAVGVPPGNLVTPKPLATTPISLELASEMGLAGHPSLAALRDEVAAAKAAVSAARSRHSPIVDLELAANKNRDMGGSPGPSDSNTAMLVMRYNLFRGGADDAKIRETSERETGAIEALNNAQRTVEEEIARAWASMTAARDALQYYEIHVKMTEDVLEAYRSQFDIGKRTMLDLMNSETELFQAKSNLTSGRFNLLLAQHRLVTGMGGLTRSLGL